MEAIKYLLSFVFDALVMILVMRVWLQVVRADFYNPLSQFIVKVSNPIVTPVRRVIPGFGGLDFATILLAYLIASLKFVTLFLIAGESLNPAAIFFFGLLYLVKQTGTLIFIIMLVMALMSWVVQGYNPTQAVFQQLTEPFLRPIRKILPNLGGLDLSIIVAFLLLNVINILIAGWFPAWQYI